MPDEVRLLPIETIEVFDRFIKAGKQIYLVGAGVRAVLTETTPNNCDFTTDATPEEMLSMFADKAPFYDNPYGTVSIPLTIDGLNEVYEITPYRTEQGYSDNRRPDEVKFGTSLEEDVKRRDFTMNAVLIGPEGKGGGYYEMIDYLNGLEDFGNKTIRAVGNPDERFGEDALRMMRAVRFAARLSFGIEEKTLAAMLRNADLLANISKERVRDELLKILTSNYPSDGIQLLVSTGLMRHIVPEIYETIGVAQTGHHHLDVYQHMLESLKSCPSSDGIVRLATWLHDIGKPATRRLRCIKCGFVMKEQDFSSRGETAKMTLYVCPRCKTQQTEHEAATFYGHEVVGARKVAVIGERLRLSKKDSERLVTLVRYHMFSYTPQMTDGAIRRFIRNVGRENISDLMLLRVGDRKGGGSKATSWRFNELQKRIGEQMYEPMTPSDMVIGGVEVMEILGIKPGPEVGRIIRELFEEVIEDTSRNTKEYLEKRVRELGVEG